MKRKFTAPVIALFILVFGYASCTRIDTTDIGNGLIPAVDNVTTFDTIFNVVTNNYLFDDSSRVYDDEDHALGTIKSDPVFGKTTAGFYMSMTPASFGASPFANATNIKFPIDSVVLSFSFKGVYGDSFNIQRFHVYEIDSSDNSFIDSARGYKVSHPGFQLRTLLKAHDQDLDRLSDKYLIGSGADTQTISNQMRIRLDNSFGERFINYDAAFYGSDSIFRTHFGGLAVLPDSNFGNPNALAYFNLKDNNNTKLTFYYKATVNGVVDSATKTSFTFNNFRNANKITRTITGTEYANAINNGTPSDDKVYIATSPGSYASVIIPGLQNLSNRVIHKAELIVKPVASPGQNTYPPPYYLFLDAYDSAAALPKTIQNDFVQGSDGSYNLALFGGFLRNGSYNFDISRYIQGIVTRKEKSYTLRIYAPYKTTTVVMPQGFASSYTVQQIKDVAQNYYTTGFFIYLNPQIANGRTVLGGGTHPTEKMQLRIIYSKI